MPALLPTSCCSTLNWPATTAAVAAAILLWGVGVEAVYFGRLLSGCFLLMNATIVSALEAATVICLVMRTRGCLCWYHCCCPQFERVTSTLDSYKRAIVYALLTVPCFVQLDVYWLPAVPGISLIIASIIYALKHCLYRRVPYDFGKMPTFVRFEDDPCCLAPELLSPSEPPVQSSELPAETPGGSTHQRNVHDNCGSGGNIYIHQPYSTCWTSASLNLADHSAVAEVNADDAPAPPPRRRQKSQQHHHFNQQQQIDKQRLVDAQEEDMHE